MRAWLPLLLLLIAALAGCASEAADGDGDGIPDSKERSGWPILVETMEYQERIIVTSDPTLKDTDGDGISDDDEFTIGTDPSSQDTDGDGLSDCQEALHTNRSQCEDVDFHGETDGGYDTDPTKADSDAGPSRYKRLQPFEWRDGEPGRNQGRWGDGLSDGDEVAGFDVDLGNGRSRHVVTDPRSTDTDGDGLEDAEEVLQFGSDPTVFDTDGDGCQDGKDAWPDRVEAYGPGLQTFTLHEDMDGDGADLRLFIVISDLQFLVGEDGIQVAVGDNDLRPHEPEAQAPFLCQLQPFDPWTKVQFSATDLDGDSAEAIDAWSLTAAAQGLSVNSPRVWWNVRTGEMAWEKGGPLLEEARFEGVQADLVMAPQVVG